MPSICFWTCQSIMDAKLTQGSTQDTGDTAILHNKRLLLSQLGLPLVSVFLREYQGYKRALKASLEEEKLSPLKLLSLLHAPQGTNCSDTSCSGWITTSLAEHGAISSSMIPSVLLPSTTRHANRFSSFAVFNTSPTSHSSLLPPDRYTVHRCICSAVR
eukprot:GHVS01046466.1.p2 GENE.GHVS01046466.1~~GHVS01046466.1.p2  ORF type:complete len:159 (+),score=22.12 GHVS01046466.1:159-635(+)